MLKQLRCERRKYLDKITKATKAKNLLVGNSGDTREDIEEEKIAGFRQKITYIDNQIFRIQSGQNVSREPTPFIAEPSQHGSPPRQQHQPIQHWSPGPAGPSHQQPSQSYGQNSPNPQILMTPPRGNAPPAPFGSPLPEKQSLHTKKICVLVYCPMLREFGESEVLKSVQPYFVELREQMKQLAINFPIDEENVSVTGQISAKDLENSVNNKRKSGFGVYCFYSHDVDDFGYFEYFEHPDIELVLCCPERTPRSIAVEFRARLELSAAISPGKNVRIGQDAPLNIPPALPPNEEENEEEETGIEIRGQDSRIGEFLEAKKKNPKIQWIFTGLSVSLPRLEDDDNINLPNIKRAGGVDVRSQLCLLEGKHYGIYTRTGELSTAAISIYDNSETYKKTSRHHPLCHPLEEPIADTRLPKIPKGAKNQRWSTIFEFDLAETQWKGSCVYIIVNPQGFIKYIGKTNRPQSRVIKHTKSPRGILSPGDVLKIVIGNICDRDALKIEHLLHLHQHGNIFLKSAPSFTFTHRRRDQMVREFGSLIEFAVPYYNNSQHKILDDRFDVY